MTMEYESIVKMIFSTLNELLDKKDEEIRELRKENEALKSLSMEKPWTVEEYEKVYSKDYYEGKIVHEVRIFGLEAENKELEKENELLKKRLEVDAVFIDSIFED